MSSPGLPFPVSVGVSGAFALLMYLRSRGISRRMDEEFDQFLRIDGILTKAHENYTNDIRDHNLQMRKEREDNDNGEI